MRDREVTGLKKWEYYTLSGLQEQDENVSPYCRRFYESRQIHELSTLKNNQNPTWKEIDHVVEWRPGQPVFVEVWNSKWGPLPDKIIGEVGIFPTEGQTSYIGTVERSVLEREVNLRTAVAQIDVNFLEIPPEGRRL